VIRWYGEDVRRRVEQQLVANLRLAAITVQNAARDNVRPGGPSGFVTSHGGRGLLGSITYEVDGAKKVARIGSNLKYARIHELGGVIVPVRANWLHFEIDGQHVMTKRVVMPARPYLRPALDNNRTHIARILSTPVKQ